jgi:hypothetical protein
VRPAGGHLREKVARNTKDPLEDRARRWTVVSQVTPWLLRALLLLRVGVEPQVLREKYLENKRFAFYQVNVEVRVKEVGPHGIIEVSHTAVAP